MAQGRNPEDKLGHFCCGLAAGALAKMGTHPLDVAKKRFQVPCSEGTRASSCYRGCPQGLMYPSAPLQVLVCSELAVMLQCLNP